MEYVMSCSDVPTFHHDLPFIPLQIEKHSYRERHVETSVTENFMKLNHEFLDFHSPYSYMKYNGTQITLKYKNSSSSY
jgi:hypothetical protein